MEILIGVLVGVDVVFIGLFYFMGCRLKTMKNRIKMTDIRLGEEVSESVRQTNTIMDLITKVDELSFEISKLKGEIYED